LPDTSPQERVLDALGEAQLLLEPLFVGADRLVQPRVLDGHGCLARQQRHHLRVVVVEGADVGALEIDDADAPVLDEQRDGQLGTHVLDSRDVPRVLAHIGREDRLLVQRGIPDDALAQPHARQVLDLAVLDRVLHLEHERLRIEQQDAEGAVVDDALGQLRDAREQLVQIQDRRELVADVRQRLEHGGVLPLPLEQARILNGHRDVGAELPQHLHVGLGETSWHVAEEVERPEHPSFASQRNHELGAGSRDRFHVARVVPHVVDDHGRCLSDGGPDERFTGLQPQRVGNRVGVADRVRNPQLAALLGEEVHGERVELDETRDELWDLVQQFVEIEDRRHLAAKVEKRCQQGAFGGGLARCHQ
jgi:hypothetical protein